MALGPHLPEHILCCAIDVQDNGVARLDDGGIALTEALGSLGNIIAHNSKDLHS